MERRSYSLSGLFGEVPMLIQLTVGMERWNALHRHFAEEQIQINDLRSFIEEVQRFYRKEYGHWLCADTGRAMALFGLPLLCSRLTEMGRLGDEFCFVVPVTLHPLDEQLQLPYEFLPELVNLRLDSEKINEVSPWMLGLDGLYYLSTHHYRGHPELVDFYSLDVEAANDRHYHFSPEAGDILCAKLGYHPNALRAALNTYYKTQGGPALEKLIREVAFETFHY